MRPSGGHGNLEDRQPFWPPDLDGRPMALLGGPDLGTCGTKGAAAGLPRD